MQDDVAAGRAAAVAFDHTFWWATVLTAVAVIPALLIDRVAPAVQRTAT